VSDSLDALDSALLRYKHGDPPPFEWSVAHAAPDAFQAAWDASCNPMTMLSIYHYTGDHRGIVLATCALARALFHDTRDPRPRAAVAAAHAWAHGRATAVQVHAAVTAARAAAAQAPTGAARRAAGAAELAGMAVEMVDDAYLLAQAAALAVQQNETSLEMRTRAAVAIRTALPTAPSLAQLMRRP